MRCGCLQIELVIVVRAGTRPQRIVVEEAQRSGATMIVLERYKFPLLGTIFYVYVAFSIYIYSIFFITLWSVVSVDYLTLASNSIHNNTQLNGWSCVKLPWLQIRSEALGFRHLEALFSKSIAGFTNTAHQLSNIVSWHVKNIILVVMNATGKRCPKLYQFLEFYPRYEPPLHELLEGFSQNPPSKRWRSCILHHTWSPSL